jgi:ABC-type molybdate transport system substrate-binding protein
VLAAGSLSDAVPDLVRRFPAGPDTLAPPEFGPPGRLRQRMETAGDADLFLPADMDQPHRLAVGHPERWVITVTRNKLCAIARPSVGMRSANMLALRFARFVMSETGQAVLVANGFDPVAPPAAAAP